MATPYQDPTYIRAQIGHMSMLITAYAKLVSGETAVAQRKVDRAAAEGRDYIAEIEAKRLHLAVERLALAQRLTSEGVRLRLLPQYRAAAGPIVATPRILPLVDAK